MYRLNAALTYATGCAQGRSRQVASALAVLLTLVRITLPFVLAGVTLAQIPVRIANVAPHERTNSWVSFTVPDKNVPGWGIVTPQGWPAVAGHKVGPNARMVHVWCNSRLGPFQHETGTLRAANSHGPLTFAAVPTVALRKRVCLLPRFSVTTNDLVEHSWEPTNVVAIERGPARVVFHAYGRIPGTMFVINTWFYVYTGSRTVPFEIFIANCDPSNSERVQRVADLKLTVDGRMFPAVDFLIARGGKAAVFKNGTYMVDLHEPTWFGQAQGAAWSGRLILWVDSNADERKSLLAEIDSPLYGMALNWAGNWGPWGVIPDLHDHENTGKQEFGLVGAKGLYKTFLTGLTVPGDLWRSWRYGNANSSAQSGDQQGFGASKLAPALAVANAGNPAHLRELTPAIWRNGGRAEWFYEQDGTPLDLAKHPQWVTWGCHTHYHPNVSRDQLGKTPWGENSANTLSAKDWAHMSSQNLAGWTILTGSYLGQHLCRGEITCFAAFESLGETRGWGRAVLSTVWNYLATGDTRALEAIQDKLYTHPALKGYHDRPTTEIVAPFGIAGRDNRWFGGRFKFWMPWQEGLLIMGWDAAAQMVPETDQQKRVMLRLCKNYITHGWWEGPWAVQAWGLRWLGGETPVPKEKYETQDPDYVQMGGPAISNWGWGAVIICKRRLAAAAEMELVQKCDRILDSLKSYRAHKAPPRAGHPIWFDRESEWKATK